ncbi:MAG: hypothetical protein IJ192_05480 [Clostridia bacterium]|nr:hypothetical protein [Clostridia bacterium]
MAKCYNFGKVSVTNPTSYLINNNNNNQPCIYQGGVIGYSLGTSSVTSCANYGEVVYDNSKGENTISTNYENTRTASNINLCVGGVVGYDYAANVKSCLNYSDVKIIKEPNANTMAGGICGFVQWNNSTLSNNLINYGNVTVPDANTVTKNNVYVGGIAGSGNSSGNKSIKYAINYGTVKAATEKATNTFVGSIIGASNTATKITYIIDLCLDLSNPPEGSTSYPLIGGRNSQSNKGTEGNFTKNEASVTATQTATGGKFGEVKLITLDKNQDTGVFSAAFPYRSRLSTEVADSTIDLDTNTENVGLNRNLDNLLVYQDYNLLSPYLQEYLVSHFGEEIKNQGAYVVLDYDDERNSRPSATTFVPAEMVSGDENDYADTDEYNREMDKLPGLRGTFFNYEFLKGKEVNSLYSALVAPSERTLATDYNFYQQQIDTSSIAEVYNIGAKTKYKYYNTDMGYNAYFTGYNNLVETHPAVDKDGNVSDTVLYTDINIYFGIDDIDTSKAVDDNDETVNTDGYIYINQLVGGNVKGNITGRAGGTTVQYYNGTKLEKTDRIRKASYDYEDEYPTPWLTCDNLDEKLAVEGDWLQEHAWGDSDIEDDQKLWVIQIPKDTNYVYTKVMGVVTAEDGIHKNIIVAHVIIDYYKPNASVDSITLTNPDNTKKVSVTGTPTTNQVLLKSETGKPSLTDFTTETDEETGETIKTPIENVIYYKVVDAAGSTVQNIQRCDYENVTSPPFITISTVNIDSSSQLKCRISRQDRLPQNDQKYNELEWNFDIEYDNNDSTTNPKYTEYITYPTDTYLDDEKKIHGTVTFNLGDSGKNKTFYGGLYRVDLFYERTKTDKDDNNYNYDYVEWKHFATVFYAKEHSPYNILSNSSNSPLTARYTGNNAFLTRLPIYTNPGNDTKSMAAQGAYDREHDPDIQTGYLAVKRTMYQWNPVLYYDYARTENDTKTDNRGYYYAYKAYVAKARGEDFVLNQHDPEESQRITKHLENRYKEIYVYCNEATGAYYPQIFKGSMEIMAENGDIRKYTTELVQNGTYGNYPENNGNKATYDNAPNIYQTAATKGGYPIIKSEDGTFVGLIGGTEKEDVTFTCTWTSSNVTLFKNSNRPSTINQNHTYDDDGYKEENVNIYFTPINSTQERKLTNDEIARYFNGNLSVSTSNVWTIKLKNSAPVGDYKIVPYMTYTMDLRSGQDPADDDKIKLYDFNDYGKAEKNILKTSETNIFTWRIPYTPFVIKNIPNDDSYLTEFHESQSKNTPFISEESNVEGSANRSVFIRTASEHGEIVYSKSYDSVKVGEENNRVRKFNIYAFVGKSDTNSNLRMKVPYLAEMYQWNGSGVPDPNDTVYWKSMSPDNSDDTEKIYSCNVSYNAIDPDTHENNFEKSVTYYKILAEDGVTYTIYQVEVIPGVRNKTTTFEVAQKAEIDDFKSSEEFNSTIGSIFEESDKLYQEILENGGTVVGTIKELGGEQILYQTKIFENEYANGASEPYIYNLKSFVFDISVDLPAGYDYEIYNFSEGKDSYTILNDSKNGYSGKELILNNSADQTLNLRIVIKRASTSQIWGVQYLWDYGNAVADEAGKILSGQGGKFYNYVYKRED